MFESFVRFVRDIYSTNEFIPLHSPCFNGNEKQYLSETIESTFVSSVGAFVDEFESMIADFTGSKYAVATVNGTSALHACLYLAGVKDGDEVITQSLTFVATCSAIRYCHAEPVFLDVDKDTLGLSPVSLELFLQEYAEIRNDGVCWNKATNRPIRACLPMHTFGHPVKIEEINNICEQYNIALIEDAAESLGSRYKDVHTGTTGLLSAISFNGNKIITTGGGGMILTNDEQLAKRAKHITTTAKKPHRWAYEHDELGFNYRMPNLNAALGAAQMEELPGFIKNKRDIAQKYHEWGLSNNIKFVGEPENTKSNYWLNTIIMENREERDALLEYTNNNKVMTRPAWVPMHKLQINQQSYQYNLKNTEWLSDRILNVPSSVSC